MLEPGQRSGNAYAVCGIGFRAVVYVALFHFIAGVAHCPGRVVEQQLALGLAHLPEGGLYFVTPTARARPAKITALADFLVSKLAAAEWKMALDGKPERSGKPARKKGAAS
ncbi:hypothetical protein HY57_13575 [Dyella japonica A8]|uniref:LysR substrate-binding domain-containing protein n=1 Tax=Dyella japonica A8 TaxID=1217721 RepID=A0A075K3D0_9GAMM|nr:hypothetical protein HY57_13575 [Dyella japonica A8]